MAKKARAPQKRLPPAEREALIIRESIPYFARAGFSANTRDLADHLGIHQRLIYQYFRNKDDLIDRIYRETIYGRWKREWEDWLRDRTMPLDRRLERYFRAFTDGIFNYEYMRIFFFAWMERPNASSHFANPIQKRILRIMSSELRHEARLPDHDVWPLGDTEWDMYEAFQSSIFYYGIRAFIFAVPPRISRDAHIALQVELFLRSAPQKLKQLAKLEALPVP